MVDVFIDWTESEITLEIKDQGEGFNSADNGDLGKPFFSNKTERVGSGFVFVAKHGDAFWRFYKPKKYQGWRHLNYNQFTDKSYIRK